MSVKIRPYKFDGIDQYVKRYSAERLNPLFDNGVADILERVGLRPNHMPRSVYRPQKLYDALYAYYEIHRLPFKKDVHFKKGVDYAWRIFAKPLDEPYLRPLPYDYSLVDSLSNAKASAGLTAYGQNKLDAFPRGLERGMAIMKGERSPEPCLAMARTQRNDKTRLVWCYPLSMNLVETQYARPLIERFKTFKSPMHFGVAQRVTSSSLRRMADMYKYAYSLDYSQFDASLSREMIFAAFRILQTWFDTSGNVNDVPNARWPWEEQGIKHSDVWSKIVNYFVTSPIVMPDGNLYYGRRNGVPSGSFFTQIIDSICNVMLVGMINHRYNLRIKEDQVFVLGDDCLIYTNKHFDLKKVSRFLHNRKVTLNADKCEVGESNEVHFLGRNWVYGKPTAPMQELVDKVTQPESYRKYAYPESDYEKELILKSYASVYHNFMTAYFESFNSDFPKTIQFLDMSGNGDVNPRHLSGLEAFNLKYLGKDTSSGILATVWK